MPHPIMHWEWETAQNIAALTALKETTIFRLATAYFDAYRGSIRPTNPLQLYTSHELITAGLS